MILIYLQLLIQIKVKNEMKIELMKMEIIFFPESLNNSCSKKWIQLRKIKKIKFYKIF